MIDARKIPGKLVSQYAGKMYEFTANGQCWRVVVGRKQGIAEARAILADKIAAEKRHETTV